MGQQFAGLDQGTFAEWEAFDPTVSPRRHATDIQRNDSPDGRNLNRDIVEANFSHGHIGGWSACAFGRRSAAAGYEETERKSYGTSAQQTALDGECLHIIIIC